MVELKEILLEDISNELPNESLSKLPADNVPTVIILPLVISIVVLPALIKLATVSQSVLVEPLPCLTTFKELVSVSNA